MWIFTTSGFLSAVEDRNDPTTLVIRSRDHASLREMCDAMEIPRKIVTNEGTDYPYRVRVSHAQFAKYVSDVALAIDYTNFKTAATSERGDTYHDVLLSIWSATFRLTPVRVARRIRQRNARRWAPIDKWLNSRDDADDLGDRLDRALHTLTDDEWRELESPGRPPF